MLESFAQVQFDMGHALPRNGLYPDLGVGKLFFAKAIHHSANEGENDYFDYTRDQITIASNGAGGRVGFEFNASRAGPLMRVVIRPKSLDPNAILQMSDLRRRFAPERCGSGNVVSRTLPPTAFWLDCSGCLLFLLQRDFGRFASRDTFPLH